MRIRRITRWLGLLLVAVIAVSGCAAPTTETAAVTEVQVVTAVTDASGYAEIELHPGVTYEVQAMAEDDNADLAGLDVALADVGDALWLQVTDPAAGYFPATDALQAPAAASGPIGVWLTPADGGTAARLAAMGLGAPAAASMGQMSLEALVEDIRDGIDAEGFATFVIALTGAGSLPETADVYPLAFENTYLLSGAPGEAGGHYVIAAAGGDALQEDGEAAARAIRGVLPDLTAARVPDWLIGADYVRADTRLHWTYAGNYTIEGIACDTAGAAIDQVLAYLDLGSEPFTQSSATDFASLTPAHIAVVSPAQGELWYDDGEGETLRLWYCESVAEAVVEEPVEEPAEEEAEEEAAEEAEEEEEAEVSEVAEAVGEATITTDGSNVRTGPGVAYPVLVTLDEEAAVSVLGKNEAGTWVQVAAPEAEEPGWINVTLLALGDLDVANLPTITDIPAPPAPRVAASALPTGCVLPRIELWAAELAPENADHVWQLVYRASGATELRIFDNVMSNPVAGTFPIYGGRDTNWVLTAVSGPGCYVERNINVVVDELPPAGTYSNAVHGFPQLGTGDVQVTLQWSGEADLDLHVIDPAGEEIYSGHMFSSSGGMLDGDVNWPCGPGPAPVENVFWPRGGAPSGEYRVLVNYYRDCKDQGPVDWTVMVRVGGNLVATQTGRISEGQTVHAVTFYK